ncbi:myb-like protein X isoform X3 [Penaeus vannamei]|uniref:myb-like protein X isoform X3 n=1 Tax=Penaeus vannamei TaxID=6689 RepID=UPI00387F4758
MPVTCAAENCSNIYQRGNNITFHCFPKNKMLREKWVKATQRKDWKPTQYSKLCSDHFLLSDFRLFTNRRELMCSAVPSIFSHTRPDQRSTSSRHKQSGEPLQMKEPTVLLKNTDSDCSTVRKQILVKEKRKRKIRRKRERWDPGKDEKCELNMDLPQHEQMRQDEEVRATPSTSPNCTHHRRQKKSYPDHSYCMQGDKHIEHSYARPLKSKGKTGIIFMDTSLGRRQQLAILTTFNVPKCLKEMENDWSTDTASEDGMAPCTTKPSSMESRMEEPLETPLADNDKVMIGDGDHDHSEVLTEDQLQVIPASKLDSIPGDNEEWETLTVSPKLDNSHDHEEGETPPTLKLDNHYDKDEKTEILPVTLNIDNGHNDAEEAPLTSPMIDDLHDNEEEEESLCSFSVNGRNRNSSEIKEVDHLHDQEDKLAQELLQLSGSSSSLINNNKQDNTEEEEIEEDEEKCKNHPLEDADIEAIQEYIQKAIQVAQDKDPDLDRSSHFAMSLSKVLELYTDLLKNRKSEEQCFTYFRPAKLSPPSHCSEDEIFFRDSGQHSTEKSSLQELQQVSDQKQDTVNNASGNQQTIGHDTESTTRSKGINCKIKEEKKEYIDEYCMSIKEEPLFDEHEYLDSIETIQEQIKEEVSSDFMQDPLFQKVGHECNINDVDENNSSSFQDFESCVEDLPGGSTSY